MNRITQADLDQICSVFGVRSEDVESLRITPDRAVLGCYDEEGRAYSAVYDLHQLNLNGHAVPIVR